MTDVKALAEGVLAGQRRALGRAITLVESDAPDDRAAAHALLQALLPHTGGAHRVGVSGTPGVGKSSFIEAAGLALIDQGQTVAVLAVDPSSPVSGGSILGDKTRMEELSRRKEAFIRPSPSKGTLGGVAARTGEVISVLEAAGHDVVIVETVGVGQSEADVVHLVDTFVLLMQPASGDDLQGVKRGVLELMDLLVVNKADGSLQKAAEQAVRDFRAGLSLFRPRDDGWRVPVMAMSAKEGTGLDDVLAAIVAHRDAAQASGGFDARRAAQAERWFWRALSETLVAEAKRQAGDSVTLPALLADVRARRVAPTGAAWDLVKTLRFGADEES